MERRELFKILGAGAVAAETGAGQHVHPGAKSAAPYTAKFFNEQQIELLTELCEIIIPSDEESPGAGKADVWQYLDLYASFWGKDVQNRFTSGLKLVDAAAVSRFGKPFLRISPAERDAIVASMAASESDAADALGRFFNLLKRQTVLGYHYSEAGLRQYMGYRGNTPVPEFPGCTHPEHQKV